MFVGYAKDHTGDTYWMWDPVTSRIHTTCDIIRLRRMFFTTPTNKEVNIIIESQPSQPSLPAATPLPTHSSGESAKVTEDELSGNGGDSNNSKRNGNEEENNNEENDKDKSIESSDESEDGEEDEDNKTGRQKTTRSGRVINPPSRYLDDLAASGFDYNYVLLLTEPELTYYAAMAQLEANKSYEQHEICAVGAGLGGGFQNTTKLKVMKYHESMQSAEKYKSVKSVEGEHEQMTKHKVWEAVRHQDLPTAAKILTSTWATKKKSNRTYRARLNARGFKQVEGEHYFAHSISSPVLNDVTIQIVLTLMIMANWVGKLLDI